MTEHSTSFRRAIRIGVSIAALIGAAGLGASAAQAQSASRGTTTAGDNDEGLDVVVTADRRDSFGTDYVQAGTFRGAKQIDTPLTVTVIPEAVLKAQQANGLIDALRNSAGVVASQITPSVYSNLTIRGITVENRGNYRLNGTLPIINLIDLPLENKLRVEALKGASSLYYGFTTPGGIINLTSKRATEHPYASFQLSGNIYGQAVASAELSNTYGPLGIRLTAAGGTQENGIRRVEGTRTFFAGAFDLHPLPGLTLQFDVEQIYKSISEPTQVQLASNATVLPALLDPKTNLGDKWLYSTSMETNYLFHAGYKVADWFSLSADLGQSRLTRTRHYSAFSFCTAALCPSPSQNAPAATLLYPNGFTASDGVVAVNQSNRLYYRNRMARAEAAFDFKAGIIKNSLVLGYSYNKRLQQVPSTANSAATDYLGTVTYAQNYFNPQGLTGAYLPLVPGATTLRSGIPTLPTRVLTTYNSIDDQAFYAFDRLEIGQWAQLLGGVRKSHYIERNELTNVQAFRATPTTFSGSVVIKPKPWVSLYGSYIEGLETTAVAPAQAVNAGAQLPASPSTQYEAGIKVEPIRNFLITAAYFDIRRQSASVNPVTFVYEFIGRARFRGVELSATGEVTPNLSLYLTALFLDPKQVSSATASLVGKVIENTPKHTWSAFAEYRMPFAPGFAVSGGAYFTGKRWVNASNLVAIPGYTLFDLGGSYTTHLSGAKVTFRINGENITGKRYWAATGSSLLGEGLPSTVKFSVQTTF